MTTKGGSGLDLETAEKSKRIVAMFDSPHTEEAGIRLRQSRSLIVRLLDTSVDIFDGIDFTSSETGALILGSLLFVVVGGLLFMLIRYVIAH